MSEIQHFTEGNLIILYSIHKNSSLQLPNHILERIEHCNRLYQIILKSKPDSNKTIILVVAEPHYSELIKKELINRQINEEIIIIDSDSNKVSHTFDNLKELLKQRINPPVVYFVGSVWLKDVFDSIVKSQFKEYKIQFEGALDKRPTVNIEEDAKKEKLEKRFTNIKEKLI